MSKQVTRWSPDTCKCVVEYSWDSDHPQESRTHTLHQVVAKCPRHVSMSDAQVYVALTDENPRKNKVRALILDSVPAVAMQRVQENGEFVTDFHPTKTFSYYFDDAHVLHVKVENMDAASKQKIQKASDAQHGANKVVVH